MAGTLFFLENRAYHKVGDNAALSSAVTDTTLKLLAPQGYYDGISDNITITDADFIAGNIKATATVFGLQGTLPVHSTEQTAAAVSNDNTKLQLTPPEGYYDGSIKVASTDAGFSPSNIKSGVSIFGITGALDNGDSEPMATGQTPDMSVMADDDCILQRGVVINSPTRFTDNLNNTITDTLTGITSVKDVKILNTANQAPLIAKGTWVNGTSYIPGDVVSYPPSASGWNPEGVSYVVGNIVTFDMGGLYRCIQDHTSSYEIYPFDTGYWEPYSFPKPADWANGTAYTVGQEVSIVNMYEGGSSSHICTTNHTSDNYNGPRSDEGMSSSFYWATKNTVFVCILSHVADLATNHCHNATYWAELPFCGSASNFTTSRGMNWQTAMYNAKRMTYLSKSWILPNIRELFSITNYGMDTPASEHPVASANDTYWSSTKVFGGVSNVSGAWAIAFSNGDVSPVTCSTGNAVMLIEKEA